MVSLRRHKRLRPCSESSSGLARPPGFCDNGTALQTSALERPHNVHLAPSNNVNQSEELRQNTAFLASKEAEKAALASLKTLESQIAEERRLWGEARSKLEADLCNSRVRLVALESELKVSKESLANVQREFHDAREAWKDMAEEALNDMREYHEQEKIRLVEMLMAKSIKAKEPTQESPSQAIPQDFRGQTNKGPDEIPNT